MSIRIWFVYHMQISVDRFIIETAYNYCCKHLNNSLSYWYVNESIIYHHLFPILENTCYCLPSWKIRTFERNAISLSVKFVSFLIMLVLFAFRLNMMLNIRKQNSLLKCVNTALVWLINFVIASSNNFSTCMIILGN